ncbi:MAG: OmpA family protein [Sulfurimonas sp.]|nr:OmpA family protein [Sulfurimonas sp.]
MNYYLFLFFGFVSLAHAQDTYPYIIPVSVEKASEQHNSQALKTQEEQTQPSEVAVIAPLQTKDSDADGISDDIDQCAETPKYFRVDGAGCPQQAVLPVHFASDSVALTTAHIQGVKEFAEFVKQHKEYQIIIYNYTNDQGDAVVNRTLSQKRANAIKEALMRNGVSSTKLTAIGRGDENPHADNATPEGREENNRTEVEIIL